MEFTPVHFLRAVRLSALLQLADLPHPAKHWVFRAHFLSHDPCTFDHGSHFNISVNKCGMEPAKDSAGIDLLEVPYKGGAPAILDVISGQVDMLFSVVLMGIAELMAAAVQRGLKEKSY